MMNTSGETPVSRLGETGGTCDPVCRRRAGEDVKGALSSRVYVGYLVAFLLLTLALGGAGSGHPLLELIVELGSLPIVFCFLGGLLRISSDRCSRAAIILLGLIILLPSIQLIPLPPTIWGEFPGRETARHILTLIGSQDRWMPLSLDSEATWRCLFELLVGAAAFVGTLSLSVFDRAKLGWLIVGGAIFSALLGAIQSSGMSGLVLFDSSHGGLATGLFVNRNHQACFLNVAIVLVAALVTTTLRRSLLHTGLGAAAIALFAATIIATRSRTGLVLVFVSIPMAVSVVSPKGLKRTAAYLGAAVLIVGAVYFSSVGQLALDRFAAPEDGRVSYWKDTLAAVRAYWPVGSGFGTFPLLFQAFESLTSVDPNYVNNAHNDFLELILEGGIVAAILMVATVVLLGFAAVSRLRTSTTFSGSVLCRAAVAAMLLVCGHSLVDYPLRMLSLMSVFGYLSALLFRSASGKDVSPATMVVKPLKSLRLILSFLAVSWAGYQATLLHVRAYALVSGNGELAEKVARGSADVQSSLAKRRLEEGDFRSASVAATAALLKSPVHAGALSALAIARAREGAGATATKLMATAAGITWRDEAAQIWSLTEALSDGNAEAAAIRADALLRQDPGQAQALSAISILMRTPIGRSAILRRLEDQPKWGKSFLTAVKARDTSDLEDQLRLLIQLRRSHVPLEPDEIAPVFRELVFRGDYEGTYRAWAEFRGGSAGKSPLFDPALLVLARDWPGSGVPFEWEAKPRRDVELTAAPHGAANELEISAEAGATGPILQQLVLLHPGKHEVRVEMSEVASNVAPEIQCDNGPRVTLGTPNGGVRPFEIPSSCVAQWLRIVIVPDDAEAHARIRSISLR